MRNLRIGAILSAVALGFGCEVPLDTVPEDPVGDERFGAAVPRCAVEGSVPVGFSLDYPEGTYLIAADAGFGVALEPGSDPCTALDGVVSGETPVVTLFDFTDQEVEQGLETPEGYELQIVPQSGVVVGGVGYVFYEKLLSRDLFDVLRIGVGVARLRYGEPAARLEVGRYASEPTLLWVDSRRGRAESAVLGDDGYVYVYSTVAAEWDQVTYVARVPIDAIADASAYEYRGEDDEWEDSEDSARPLLVGMPSLSVIRVDSLGRYAFVFPGFLSDSVYGKIGDTPFGPFGDTTLLFEGESPEEFWIQNVAAHGVFGVGGERRFVASYFTDPENTPAGLRFVDVALR
jgi:hypothetical protein